MKIQTTSSFVVSIGFGILISTAIHAQPQIEWTKSYGGSFDDIPWVIIQTTDGGYAIAGSTQSVDGDVTGGSSTINIWVVKLSATGEIEWENCLASSSIEEPRDMVQTQDGGYAITGHSQENNDLKQLLVVKLDHDGEPEWTKSYGSTVDDWGMEIIQLQNGTLLVSGLSGTGSGDVSVNHGGSDGWLLNLDMDGSILSQHSYGGSSDDWASCILPTVDGGFIVSGAYRTTQKAKEAWFLKLDNDRNYQWDKKFGGSKSDELYAVIQTPDGGYLGAGRTESNDGDVTGFQGIFDYWVVKIDASGSLEWQKTIGGSKGEELFSMSPSADGGYLLFGWTTSSDGDVSEFHGTTDYWLVKMDDSGEIVWEQTYGGFLPDYGTSVASTSDGGIILTGFSMSTDGDVNDHHDRLDYWVVKLSPASVGTKDESYSSLVQLYPNPVSSVLHYSFDEIHPWKQFEIINTAGVTVHVGLVDRKNNINVQHLQDGLYFLRFTNGEQVHVTKFIKE